MSTNKLEIVTPHIALAGLIAVSAIKWLREEAKQTSLLLRIPPRILYLSPLWQA